MAKKSAVDLSVPKEVQDNARKGLELRKEHGFGGTKVGEGTAKLLSEGGKMTGRKVRHIAAYFPRHAGDNLDQTGKSGKPSRGYIAWLLWGGDAGRKWSEALVRNLDEEGGDGAKAEGAAKKEKKAPARKNMAGAGKARGAAAKG